MLSNNNKNKNPLILFWTVALIMVALSWILMDTIAYNQQDAYADETETQNTEETTEEIEETTEEDVTEEVELNKVYSDLDIEANTTKLDISDDGKYFSYRCYYNSDVINFISKIDTSSKYELIDIYKDGSYEFVVFKCTE